MIPECENRVAIVTGAAGGIGGAIVDALLKDGMRIVAVDLSTEALDERYRDGENGDRVFSYGVDLSDRSSWSKIVEFCIESCGSLDVLVNNAGRIIRGSIRDSSVDEWEQQISVNMKAAYFLSKLCVEEMQKNQWGRIINLSSQAAKTGGAADCAIYATSKGGVESMTRSFARAYAGNGITVNAVAPGVVMTSMIEKTLSPEKIASVVANIPIGRVSEADEIASAVVFLCSDSSGSITGHVLDMSGGMTIR